MRRVKIWDGETDDGVLPRVCIVCGRDGGRSQALKFAWAPRWTHALLIVGCVTGVGILPWLILRAVLHTSKTVHLSMCDRHRHYWQRRRLVAPACVFGSLAVLLGSLVQPMAAQNGPPVWALTASFALILAALVVSVVHQFRGTRVAKIVDDKITFDGVSSQFADELTRDRDEARREERERRERRKLEGRPSES